MKTFKKRVYTSVSPDEVAGYGYGITFSDRTTFACGHKNGLPRFFYAPGPWLYAAPESHPFTTCLAYARLYVQSKTLHADRFVCPAPGTNPSYRRFWGRMGDGEPTDVALPDVDWDAFYGLIAGCHRKKYIAPLVDWMLENFTHDPWVRLLSDEPDTFWSALTGLPLRPPR